MNTPHDDENDHDHNHNGNPPKIQMPELSPEQMEAVGDFFGKIMSRKGLQIVTGGLLTIVTLGTFIFAMSHKDVAQIQTILKNKKDVNWLVTPQPNFELAQEQFSLYISNTDPSRGSPGILEDEMVRGAYRYRALSFTYQGTPPTKPGKSCYQKDISACYEIIADNLAREYQDKPGASGRGYVASETKILNMAQYANLPPVPEPTGTLYARVVEKFRQDTNLARQSTLEGQLRLQDQANTDMKNGATPGGQ